MTIIIDLIKNNGSLTFASTMEAFIYYFTNVISLLFFVMYFHQMFFIILGSVHHCKPSTKCEIIQHKIGIVISARDESKVIGKLIDSIRLNDYPQSLITIFVIADNCADDTAQIARDKGCVVFERHNTELIGKGYALNTLFTALHTDPQYADLVPDAYIVLDADNIIRSDYITEMNKVYCSGYNIVTSYRNSKNFGRNWITSGYGYWFLHEARHLNNSRMMLKTSCAISGTGFLIDKKVVEEYGNWKFFYLTEDIQCSTEYALQGNKVGYCGTAEFFDEQPYTFKQSWVQRERWAKGFYQVFGHYGGRLFGGFFRRFACWDIFTTIFPALFVMILTLTVLPVTAIVALCMGDTANAWYAVQSVLSSFLGYYQLLFVVGLLICITEWKKIHTSWWKKILYTFTFPLFMATYIPISLVAFFKKVEWKPIVHTADIGIEEMSAKKNA
ncbi:MAG: glycosyltransferase [Corallococcus sp.]|nr:glycosyltransferase [Corallococcus sp.]